MTQFPYILFNQSPDQLRRIGSLGGKARARNWRRRPLTQIQAPAIPPPFRVQTTAQAIAVLDAQCPWLCGAEKRTPPHPRKRT